MLDNLNQFFIFADMITININNQLKQIGIRPFSEKMKHDIVLFYQKSYKIQLYR